MIKKLTAVLMSIITMAVIQTPWTVNAMTDTTVEIPFTCENYPANVVIEAVDDAPLGEVTQFTNVKDGIFKISYSEPDDYRYKIYQTVEDTDTIDYDDVVYNVIVSIYVDGESDNLYSFTTIGIDGEDDKKTEVSFKNNTITSSKVDESSNSDSSSTDGDNKNPQTGVVITGSIACTIGLMAIAFLSVVRRNKEDE